MTAPARFGCALCKFAHFLPGDTHGLCRRKAPLTDSYGGAMWPAVALVDWCGDGRPRGQGGAE